jgi:hypothetical protein
MMDRPEAHARVVAALRAGGPAVPAQLHERIAALLVRRERRRRRLAFALAPAAALALASVALLVAAPGPSTTVSLARVVTHGPTGPAPRIELGRPELLERRFAGVTFPNWIRRFDWIAVGSREDTVGGRRAASVFYRHTHHTIAYTVVAGEPLRPPASATRARVGGVVVHRFRDGPRDVVMFVRGGRTCVLAGEVHDPLTLVRLAAWRGDATERVS